MKTSNTPQFLALTRDKLNVEILRIESFKIEQFFLDNKTMDTASLLTPLADIINSINNHYGKDITGNDFGWSRISSRLFVNVSSQEKAEECFNDYKQQTLAVAKTVDLWLSKNTKKSTNLKNNNIMKTLFNKKNTDTVKRGLVKGLQTTFGIAHFTFQSAADLTLNAEVQTIKRITGELPEDIKRNRITKTYSAQKRVVQSTEDILAKARAASQSIHKTTMDLEFEMVATRPATA